MKNMLEKQNPNKLIINKKLKKTRKLIKNEAITNEKLSIFHHYFPNEKKRSKVSNYNKEKIQF